MIETATTISLVLLSTAALLCMVRMLRAGTIANRVIALDSLLVIVVCALAVYAARTGDLSYLNVLVVVALLGFVSTSLAAALIERRGI